MKLQAMWQMEGTLETVTPLHVGDGDVRMREFTRGKRKEAAEIQTVARMSNGHARIPGSSLKGVVRSGIGDSSLAGALFGKKEGGGLAAFLDAQSEAAIDWDANVLGRTAIDAVTGAAQNHLLFHLERVPERTRFQFQIRGKSFEGASWREMVALLDTGFERFNQDAIQLGAGEGNDWGRCRYTLTAVRVMEQADVSAWLAKPTVLAEALGRLRDRKDEVPRCKPEAMGTKAIKIGLVFEGHPFLVNDPTRTGKKEDGKTAHAARRTLDGKLLLPAESFRGVLAHQAARIARTKGKPDARKGLARVNGALPAGVDALRRLFGVTGWASVIGLTDFTERSTKQNSVVQQFLAVDRFTGGGAEERKFNAEGGWQPRLDGVLSVDMERLIKLGNPKAAMGLLALTLRDLAEGDLSFGWGSGKGYGWATVDTGGKAATAWVEERLQGWCEGTVPDWIEAWEQEASGE